MIVSNYLERFAGLFPVEMRLARRAKSGEINAFVELCWPQREQVFRYLFFVSPNLNVAEGLVVQTFFKAWEQLKQFPWVGISFETWLFSIAYQQIQNYYRTHKNIGSVDTVLTLSARGGGFLGEYLPIHESLQNLSANQQHALILKYVVGLTEKDIARVLSLGRTQIRRFSTQALCLFADIEIFDEGMRRAFEESLDSIQTSASSLTDGLNRHLDLNTKLGRFLKAALVLDSGRDVQPLPAFDSYLHTALTEYLKARTWRSFVASDPALRRATVAFAMLVVALLATGTAYAQAAVPGQPLYAWKRVSEMVWHSLSFNPVATDILLSERRLDEWLAVADDPALSDQAMQDYQASLEALNASNGNQKIIQDVLLAQQVELSEAGLASPDLDAYLKETSGTAYAYGTKNAGVVKKNPVTPAAPPQAHGSDVEVCNRECKDDILPAHGTSAQNGNGNADGAHGAGNGNAGGNNGNAGKDKGNNGKGPGNDNGKGSENDNGKGSDNGDGGGKGEGNDKGNEHQGNSDK